MNVKKQSGFSTVEVVVVILILAVIGAVGFFVMGKQSTKTKQQTGYTQGTPGDDEKNQPQESKEFIWQQTEEGWRSKQKPAECPAQPMMKMPADISKVTGVLYPGQTRGGNYKPHGGFRFDGTANDKVTVTAPIGGFIVKGGHYLAEGEIQYTFDVMNNCGVMYRVGHLRVIPENLQKIAETWPTAVEGDSRTHQVNPALYLAQGETLATSVGTIKTKNTFFDWGVYDYRQQNPAIESGSYRQGYDAEKELATYAVCWFDWLPSSDAAKIKSLPAGDPTSGKTSDYCK